MAIYRCLKCGEGVITGESHNCTGISKEGVFNTLKVNKEVLINGGIEKWLKTVIR